MEDKQEEVDPILEEARSVCPQVGRPPKKGAVEKVISESAKMTWAKEIIISR